ncbi:MAG: response regulator [Candidatus Manganitrophus sp. SA1]|nr:response regulator [Candidatus Manganitrophus morganii]
MKILIVDDSSAMRSLISRTLRKAGYEEHLFQEANSVAEAMRFLKDSPPDLIISDWNMPQMSGLALLQMVRKENPKIKFGFVTSEAETEMQQKAIALGALFMITKPFTVEAFQKALGPLISEE